MNRVWSDFPDKKEKPMFLKALTAAKRRAGKKNLQFDISIENIISQYTSQSGKCFYSGIDMNIVKSNCNGMHDPYKMTLDCKEPSVGYKKENIVWCIYCINSFKQRMPVQEVINICYNIIECNNEKK
jgi:hypothetical protein